MTIFVGKDIFYSDMMCGRKLKKTSVDLVVCVKKGHKKIVNKNEKKKYGKGTSLWFNE